MPQIETLFNSFTSHLTLLRNNKIIETEGEYICPLCLKTFRKEQIENLSLEDAPQRSLGGRKIAITCKECNNSCGYKIDTSLVNYLKYLDEKDFVPGSNRKVKVHESDRVINGLLEVGNNKEFKIILPNKNNNPKNLEKHIAAIGEGDIVNVENNQLKIDMKMASVAILKNAYIILFSKFGYTFLLDSFYDKIRSQILEPMKYIVPDLWTKQNISVNDGVYFSNSNLYRGFFVVYSCISENLRTHRFCVCIPTPMLEYMWIHRYFSNYIPNTPIYMRNHQEDFLADIKNINALKKWIYGWGMKL